MPLPAVSNTCAADILNMQVITLTCITAPEIPVAAGTEHLSNTICGHMHNCTHACAQCTHLLHVVAKGCGQHKMEQKKQHFEFVSKLSRRRLRRQEMDMIWLLLLVLPFVAATSPPLLLTEAAGVPTEAGKSWQWDVIVAPSPTACGRSAFLVSNQHSKLGILNGPTPHLVAELTHPSLGSANSRWSSGVVINGRLVLSEKGSPGLLVISLNSQCTAILSVVTSSASSSYSWISLAPGSKNGGSTAVGVFQNSSNMTAMANITIDNNSSIVVLRQLSLPSLTSGCSWHTPAVNDDKQVMISSTCGRSTNLSQVALFDHSGKILSSLRVNESSHANWIGWGDWLGDGNAFGLLLQRNDIMVRESMVMMCSMRTNLLTLHPLLYIVDHLIADNIIAAHRHQP